MIPGRSHSGPLEPGNPGRPLPPPHKEPSPMSITLRQQLIRGLTAKGELLITQSTRYDVFTRTTGRKPTPHRYFVGHAGALRVGRTVTTSVPASDQFKRALIVLGAAATVEPMSREAAHEMLRSLLAANRAREDVPTVVEHSPTPSSPELS